eukprot:10714823-Ditylum_brightwellii.AAC.1
MGFDDNPIHGPAGKAHHFHRAGFFHQAGDWRPAFDRRLGREGFYCDGHDGDGSHSMPLSLNH